MIDHRGRTFCSSIQGSYTDPKERRHNRDNATSQHLQGTDLSSSSSLSFVLYCLLLCCSFSVPFSSIDFGIVGRGCFSDGLVYIIRVRFVVLCGIMQEMLSIFVIMVILFLCSLLFTHLMICFALVLELLFILVFFLLRYWIVRR